MNISAESFNSNIDKMLHDHSPPTSLQNHKVFDLYNL